MLHSARLGKQCCMKNEKKTCITNFSALALPLILSPKNKSSLFGGKSSLFSRIFLVNNCTNSGLNAKFAISSKGQERRRQSLLLSSLTSTAKLFITIRLTCNQTWWNIFFQHTKHTIPETNEKLASWEYIQPIHVRQTQATRESQIVHPFKSFINVTH